MVIHHINEGEPPTSLIQQLLYQNIATVVHDEKLRYLFILELPRERKYSQEFSSFALSHFHGFRPELNA